MQVFLEGDEQRDDHVDSHVDLELDLDLEKEGRRSFLIWLHDLFFVSFFLVIKYKVDISKCYISTSTASFSVTYTSTPSFVTANALYHVSESKIQAASPL